MQEIMVSILCLAYNHEKYIRKTLESVISQKTNFRFEVIVHDDASTDGTTEIIREFEKKYPDIFRPIYQTENQYYNSPSLYTSYIIPKAQGKYCAICECDDFWIDENKLQKQVDYMESHPECTLCIHNAVHADVNDNFIGKVEPTTEDRIIPCEEVILGGGDFCATNSILAPTRLMKNVPPYFNKITIDYIWQIYLAGEGQTFCFAEPMSAYRIGVENSWTSQMTSKKNRKKLCDTYTQINEALSDYDELTNFAYHEAVTESQIRRQFEILYIERQFEELKKEPYRSCVKKINLPMKNKLICFVGMHCPKLLELLEKFV